MFGEVLGVLKVVGVDGQRRLARMRFAGVDGALGVLVRVHEAHNAYYGKSQMGQPEEPEEQSAEASAVRSTQRWLGAATTAVLLAVAAAAL